VYAKTIARPAASIERPRIANTRKAATWSWPTQKSPSRSWDRQQRHPHRVQRRSEQNDRADEAQQHEDQRRRVFERQLHHRPIGGPGDDNDR
jgi:hypothetical protein